jgi:polyhydroxyalkanoate synthesis regulator phasin
MPELSAQNVVEEVHEALRETREETQKSFAKMDEKLQASIASLEKTALQTLTDLLRRVEALEGEVKALKRKVGD